MCHDAGIMRLTPLVFLALACAEATTSPSGTADAVPVDLGPAPPDAPAASDHAAPPDTTTEEPDTGPVVPTSGPRAYVLSAADTDVIGAGRMADARPGDIVLRNDVIRVVIRSGDEALYLAGLGGGAIVDALPEGLPPEADQLQEHVPLLQFHGFGRGTVTPHNLADAAEVVYEGSAVLPKIVDGYIGGLGIAGLSLKVTYRLAAGESAVQITAETVGTPTAQAAIVNFPGGGVEIVNDLVNGWVSMTGPEVGYGIVADDPFTVAEFGGLSLLFGPSLVATDDATTWTHWFLVTDGALSSALDATWALRLTPVGKVSGTVSGAGPGVEVVARDAANARVSAFRPDATGAFAGTLPIGLYKLTTEGPGRLPGAPVSADVTLDAPVTGLALSAEAAGSLVVTVPEATRLTIDGETVPLPPGETRVPLAPGTHTVHASRGFEYELDTREVVLTAGETVTWSPVVKRSVDTSGWIAADFHLHSEWSTDSSVPLPARVVACSAEGVEYAVATDHDLVTDYSASVPASLAGRLVVGIGVEVSTSRWGHVNVWPLEVDKDKASRGAPAWQGLEFGELMGLLAPETPGRVVQINHGRSKSSAETFTQVGWDPDHRDVGLLADMRFTAMELINDDGHGYEELMADWFSFIDEGLSVAATGVSDAHSIGTRCGHARTYVEVADDDPAKLTATEANQGVLMRRTIATNGPFITIEAVSASIVHVRVQGPSWMPIETLDVYIDGVLDQTIPLAPYAGDVVRFDADVVLKKATPRWAVAEAHASTSAPPVANNRIRGMSPAVFLP